MIEVILITIGWCVVALIFGLLAGDVMSNHRHDRKH